MDARLSGGQWALAIGAALSFAAVGPARASNLVLRAPLLDRVPSDAGQPLAALPVGLWSDDAKPPQPIRLVLPLTPEYRRPDGRPFGPTHLLAQVETGGLSLALSESAREGWLVAAGRAGGFVAGAWAAALTHELGHALVAWGYGYRFVWPTTKERSELFLPLWDTTSSQNNNGAEMPLSARRNIGMAGFVLSAGVSETFLAMDTFPKSDVFVGGFIFYDLLNAIVYVARDIIIRARYPVGAGDIRDMAKGGIPREVVYGVLLLRSALVLARVLEDPDFLKLSYWWNSAEPY